MANIDVIIVNYNSGAYLARCLQSLLRSTLPLSGVVVDNASSDGSQAVVAQCKARAHQLALLQNTENRGFSRAVNQGASKGKAEAVFLLNPDCYVFPHTLEKLLAALQANSEMGVIGALVLNEDGSEQRGCRRDEPTLKRSMVTALGRDHKGSGVNQLSRPLPKGLTEVDAVSGAALMIRREVFEQLGGMDEGYFLHVEDLDLCRRVRDAGYKVGFLPTVSVLHHQGASSQALPLKTEWHKHQGMLRYHRQHLAGESVWWGNGLYRAMVLAHLAMAVLKPGVRQVRARLFGDTVGKAFSQPVDFAAFSQTPLTAVAGARSDLGEAVLARLAAAGQRCIAVSRGALPNNESALHRFRAEFFDKMPKADLKALMMIDRAVLVLPVWAAAASAEQLSRGGGLKRVVAFSSTSVFGKKDSTDAKEQAVVKKLLDGESQLLDWAQQNATPATVLRASMIYGGKRDQSVGFIRKIGRIFRFFSLVDAGNAKRQPVHIDDLADVGLSTLNAEKSPQPIYEVAGGEVLSYRQMVERIFSGAGIKPRFVSLSPARLKTLIGLMRRLPGLGFLSQEMVSRMQQDLTYDISAAKRELAYNPGKFRP